MPKRFARGPQQPLSPPVTAEEGGKRILAATVATFDRKDGTGADWPLLVEAIFRAGFEACGRLSQDDRRRLLARVHAGAYERLTSSEGGNATPAPQIEPKGQNVTPEASTAPNPRGPK